MLKTAWLAAALALSIPIIDLARGARADEPAPASECAEAWNANRAVRHERATELRPGTQFIVSRGFALPRREYTGKWRWEDGAFVITTGDGGLTQSSWFREDAEGESYAWFFYPWETEIPLPEGTVLTLADRPRAVPMGGAGEGASFDFEITLPGPLKWLPKVGARRRWIRISAYNVGEKFEYHDPAFHSPIQLNRRRVPTVGQLMDALEPFLAIEPVLPGWNERPQPPLGPQERWEARLD